MPYMMQPGDHMKVAEAISKHLGAPGHFDKPPAYPGQTANADAEGRHPLCTWRRQADVPPAAGWHVVSGKQKGELFDAVFYGKVEGNQSVDFVGARKESN
jgi:hypothetical protein